MSAERREDVFRNSPQRFLNASFQEDFLSITPIGVISFFRMSLIFVMGWWRFLVSRIQKPMYFSIISHGCTKCCASLNRHSAHLRLTPVGLKSAQMVTNWQFLSTFHSLCVLLSLLQLGFSGPVSKHPWFEKRQLLIVQRRASKETRITRRTRKDTRNLSHIRKVPNLHIHTLFASDAPTHQSDRLSHRLLATNSPATQ